jgi:2-amino-4-hydroxy-6-hydroxymethyldihydropteridine diphosphokinase
MTRLDAPPDARNVHQVYLGLGSNLDDRDELLRAAITRLGAQVRVERVSSVYDTAPLLVTDQPRFHNIVCAGTTHLAPLALLRFTQEIESALGRKPTIRYGPRRIDVDIVFYDALVIETPELVLPHPGLAERAFVLAPLAEIAPDLLHPRLHLPAVVLLARLPQADVRRLGPLFPPSG